MNEHNQLLFNDSSHFISKCILCNFKFRLDILELLFTGNRCRLYEPADRHLSGDSTEIDVGRSRPRPGGDSRAPDHARRRHQPDRQVLSQKPQREDQLRSPHVRTARSGSCVALHLFLRVSWRYKT
jgi:hypothetical protein